ATTAAAHVLLPFKLHIGVPLPKLTGGLTSRDTASTQTSLIGGELAFMVNATVGTPGQQISLIVSPSASDTWVPDATSSDCDPSYYSSYYGDDYNYTMPDPSCVWGSYNSSLSSTYLPANSKYSSFDASYMDGTDAYGTNVTDRLALGDIVMDDYSMGVVQSADRWIGVLGLGPNSTSSSSYYSSSYPGKYAHFLDRLVSSGKIATPAYSLWLDDADAKSGSLLFGAVDQSKFEGSLVRLDADASNKYQDTFAVSLNAVNGSTSSGSDMSAIKSNDYPFTVAISPGDTFSYLPSLIASKIMIIAGARYNRTIGRNVISCDAAKSNSAKFAFELGGSGGPVVTSQVSDLILAPGLLRGGSRYSYFADSPNLCLFGIQNYSSSSSSYSTSDTSTSRFSIGNSLLRRSYLVFDVVNEEVAFAPTKMSSGSEKPNPTIVSFANYAAKVPSSSIFCSASSGNGNGNGNGNGSGSGTDSDTSSSGDSNPLSRPWVKVVIGISVSFGTIILIALGVAAVLWRRAIVGGKTVPTKDLDDESLSGPAGAAGQNVMSGGSGPAAVAPGALPSIPEHQGVVGGGGTQAPQLPALAGQEPMMAVAVPAGSSDRGSVAVSALSTDEHPSPHATAAEVRRYDEPLAPTAGPEPEREAPAPPRSPKGK
ncbi:aspartic peptidase domain-containing protein, partial [Lasiosphaeria miniovina]